MIQLQAKNMKTEFKEEQKFTQWWLWLILIGIGLLPIFGIYKQLILKEQWRDNSMSDAGLILYTLFTFCLIAMFWLLKLKTEINDLEIQMKFFPFSKKRINWKEIKSVKIVNYGFVGGWGIRLWTKYGTVYNTQGNKGLAIELLSGRKFLIGTQKENELAETLKNLNK